MITSLAIGGAHYQGTTVSRGLFARDKVGTIGRGFIGPGFLGGLLSRGHRYAQAEAEAMNTVPEYTCTYTDRNGKAIANMPYTDEYGIVHRTDATGRARKVDVSHIEEKLRQEDEHERYMAEIIRYYLVDDDTTAWLLGLKLADWLELAKPNGTAPAKLGEDQKALLGDSKFHANLRRHNCTIHTIKQHSIDARVATQATMKLKYIIESIGIPEFIYAKANVAGGAVPTSDDLKRTANVGGVEFTGAAQGTFMEPPE